MLDGSKDAFRVWHHDRDSSVGGGERGDAVGRAVRIRGIACGDLAVTIDESCGNEPTFFRAAA